MARFAKSDSLFSKSQVCVSAHVDAQNGSLRVEGQRLTVEHGVAGVRSWLQPGRDSISISITEVGDLHSKLHQMLAF